VFNSLTFKGGPLPGTPSDVCAEVSVAAHADRSATSNYLPCIETQTFEVGRRVSVQRASSRFLDSGVKRTKEDERGASCFFTTPLFFFRLFEDKAASPAPSAWKLSSDVSLTRAAVRTPFRVERAADGATVIHRSSEPISDERAYEQYCDEDKDAQERILQALCLSSISC
jgi:hypothetical protein